MRRLAPCLLIASLAGPAPAAARIRVVDLHSGAVRTGAAGRDVQPLGWRGGAVLGWDGAAVRRYPGSKRLLRLRGARDVALGGDRVAAVMGAGEHGESVAVRGLGGRDGAARRFAGFIDSLAWSPHGARLAVGWTDQRLHNHLTILTPRLRALRTVASPAQVSVAAGGWAPGGRSVAYLAKPQRLGVHGGPRPGEIRSLDVATGHQAVLFRGTRCDTLICELLEAPQAASGGRVALVRDLNAVALLRPRARPQTLALPADCDGVDAVAWAGASLAVVSMRGNTARLALLLQSAQPRTIATLGRGEAGGVLVSGRRAAVYQR